MRCDITVMYWYEGSTPAFLESLHVKFIQSLVQKKDSFEHVVMEHLKVRYRAVVTCPGMQPITELTQGKWINHQP